MSRDDPEDRPPVDPFEREVYLKRMTDEGELITPEEYRRRSRRAFLTFGALGLGGYMGFRTVQNRPEDDRLPDVLRTGLEWNERVWETLQRDGASARTFSESDREELRVNGRIGLADEVPADAGDDWEIRVIGVDGGELEPRSIADVRSVGERNIVWEHKCIEGWSNIVGWTGVRFSDFVARFAPDQTDWNHVSLRTPDEEYYVGIDRYTMLHHQTLLAWELNGEPLTSDHGAPLRLVTPLKYGIKQLKRISTIEFSTERPADYWAERGYDDHSGF